MYPPNLSQYETNNYNFMAGLLSGFPDSKGTPAYLKQDGIVCILFWQAACLLRSQPLVLGTSNTKKRKNMREIIKNTKKARIIKLFVLACVIFIGFILQGCSYEEFDSLSADKVKVGNVFVEKCIAKAAESIELRDNRYVWNLNRNDALRIGLSSGQIEQIRFDIESANQQITIWEEQEVPYFLTDPKSKFVVFMNMSESTDIILSV